MHPINNNKSSLIGIMILLFAVVFAYEEATENERQLQFGSGFGSGFGTNNNNIGGFGNNNNGGFGSGFSGNNNNNNGGGFTIGGTFSNNNNNNGAGGSGFGMTSSTTSSNGEEESSSSSFGFGFGSSSEGGSSSSSNNGDEGGGNFGIGIPNFPHASPPSILDNFPTLTLPPFGGGNFGVGGGNFGGGFPSSNSPPSSPNNNFPTLTLPPFFNDVPIVTSPPGNNNNNDNIVDFTLPPNPLIPDLSIVLPPNPFIPDLITLPPNPFIPDLITLPPNLSPNVVAPPPITINPIITTPTVSSSFVTINTTSTATTIAITNNNETTTVSSSVTINTTSTTNNNETTTTTTVVIGGSGTFCFSGGTVAYVENKGLVEMRRLKIGDYVAVDKKKDSTFVFEPIYSFGHYEPNNNHKHNTNFLEIRTNSSNPISSKLQITRQHLIYKKGVTHPVPASSIQRGDQLVLLGKEEVVTVSSVYDTISITTGLYAPFTPSGKLLVNNGLLVSSYVALDDTSSDGQLELFNGMLRFSYHWLARSFEVPHRIVCTSSLFGSGSLLSWCSKETYTKDGISNWVAIPMKFTMWLLQKHPFQQILILPIICILALFSLLEQTTTLLLLLVVVVLVRFGRVWNKTKI